MAGEYIILLSDGATNFTIHPLETDGMSVPSTPRLILNTYVAGPNVTAFILGGDVSYRFTIGFSFTVQLSGGANGVYTVFSNSLFLPQLNPILAVTTGLNGTFSISGDFTSIFVPGYQFQVTGSTNNNAHWTVLSSTFFGGNTVITVTGTIGAIADGSIIGGVTKIPVTPQAGNTTLPLGQIVYTIPSDTSLTLPGKGNLNYGQSIMTDFVHLLESAANIAPPSPALKGQLWFDTTPGVNQLKVYDAVTPWTIPGTGIFVLKSGDTMAGVLELVSGSFGYQIVNVGGAKVLTSPTGLANNATVYTATVAVNGGGPIALSIIGSAAQTYATLLTLINISLGINATATLVGGNIKITSKLSGLGSTISIVDTNLFNSLTGYVAILGAIPGAYSSSATPALTFDGATDKGFYNSGTNEFSIAISGVQKVKFNSSGITTYSGYAVGSATPSMALWHTSDTATGISFPSTGNMNINVATLGTVSIKAAGTDIASINCGTGDFLFNDAQTLVSATPGSISLNSYFASPASNASGGNLYLSAGDGDGTGIGGNLAITSGNGGITGNGGGAGFGAGMGGATSGNGGTTSITGGSATNGTGGPVEIRGGTTSTTGSGGHAYLIGGNGGVTSGNGGPTGITGGFSFTGTGGNVDLTGGESNAGSASSGSIRILTGHPPVERLKITGVGEWQLAGSGGVIGNIITSNGPGTPPTWQTVVGALGYTPVNKAGDTMTGLLILSGDPVAALGAATKQYVDAGTSPDYTYVSSAAGQTLFSTGFTYILGSHRLMVFVNGIKQVYPPNGNYVETDTTHVTFTPGLNLNDQVEFYNLK